MLWVTPRSVGKSCRAAFDLPVGPVAGGFVASIWEAPKVNVIEELAFFLPPDAKEDGPGKANQEDWDGNAGDMVIPGRTAAGCLMVAAPEKGG